MWKSTIDGRALHFHLAGINNQNFIMRDDETGTWWQQVTGCGILGPLKGRCLEAIYWDEVTFDVWTKEHPETLVLRPAEAMKDDYATADWEKEIAEYPTPAPADSADPADPLQPRDLVVGVAVGPAATAYPFAALATLNIIVDEVGGTPILILLHPDGRSLRCFERRLDGEPLEMFLDPGLRDTDPGEPGAGGRASAEPGSAEPSLLDGRTGSRWDFAGRATEGPLAGRQLARVACLKDFWFDWKTYHPGTAVFEAAGSTGGEGAARKP